ncbi:MAG: hypothetical protein GY829_02625, partial [Gammaproteobacteria bacterium]|nr:hypothetical protein [Gammaproteobacteria bacterium]
LNSILESFEAKKLWVGHTPTPELKVRSRLNKLLTVMDTGMLHSYYNGEPWAAKITKDASPVYINGLSGKHEKAIISPNRNSPNPHNMTDLELEEFLKTAEIIGKEDIGEGITKPIKVALSANGVTVSAVFKSIDSKPGNERGRWKKDIYDADRYKYEVAAYKLDRMLKLGLVPVTVERTINGKQGALQLWVDNLMSKKYQKKNNIPYNGFCNFKDQVNMMDTFDYLIRNTDRNKSNILYDADDWQVWFIDHSRSFGLLKTRPRMMKKHKVKVTNEFKKALSALSYEQLSELSPWLHKKQIRAIWDRRKKLIRGKF